MSARQAYDQLKTAIEAAVDQKNYTVALGVAEELDMTGGETGHTTHLADYAYNRTYEDGEVTFQFVAYDTSKTFEPRPDVNQFRLELRSGGKRVDSHSTAYHD